LTFVNVCFVLFCTLLSRYFFLWRRGRAPAHVAQKGGRVSPDDDFKSLDKDVRAERDRVIDLTRMGPGVIDLTTPQTLRVLDLRKE
jgi:hypothetical protein